MSARRSTALLEARDDGIAIIADSARALHQRRLARVPLSLIVFQLKRMIGMRGSQLPTASRIGVPVNLFDAMRLVFRKG